MSDSTDQLSFPAFLNQPVIASFDGPEIVSDAGWLLLAQIDRQIGLTQRLADTLLDPREPCLVRHSLLYQLRQRVYQIAAGYEDCNDATTLRRDPLLKTVLGKTPSQPDLASQPTLSRFENGRTRKELHALCWSLVEHFIQSRQGRPPYRLVLDLDGTEDQTHGQQHFSFYNGYVRHHCFFPLVVTATCDHEAAQFPVGVLLRAGNSGAAKGAIAVLKRLIERFRQVWPHVFIEVRLDGGFAKPELYEWLEAHRVAYDISLPKNPVLEALAKPLLAEARRAQKQQGGTVRHFGQVAYRAKSWNRSRRVIIKAEVTPQGDNPRFLVTSHQRGEPEKRHRCYTGRGDMENRIKEWKGDLAGDRTSCSEFEANQFRVLLHLTAYLLWLEVRKRLSGSGLGRAQVGQLMLRLMKVGAFVQERARGVRVRISASYPAARYWRLLALSWEPIPDG